MAKSTTYKGQRMPHHAAVYYEANGYGPGDFVPSEISGLQADDINHLDPRGMGGSKLKDTPENLMALNRKEHNFFEANPDLKWWFKKVHEYFMLFKTPYYWDNPTDPILKLITES